MSDNVKKPEIVYLTSICQVKRARDMVTNDTGCSLIIVFFLVVIFLNSASSAAAVLVFDLPLCSRTDTEGKPREARVRNIF